MRKRKGLTGSMGWRLTNTVSVVSADALDAAEVNLCQGNDANA